MQTNLVPSLFALAALGCGVDQSETDSALVATADETTTVEPWAETEQLLLDVIQPPHAFDVERSGDIDGRSYGALRFVLDHTPGEGFWFEIHARDAYGTFERLELTADQRARYAPDLVAAVETEIAAADAELARTCEATDTQTFVNACAAPNGLCIIAIGRAVDSIADLFTALEGESAAKKNYDDCVADAMCRGTLLETRLKREWDVKKTALSRQWINTSVQIGAAVLDCGGAEWLRKKLAAFILARGINPNNFNPNNMPLPPDLVPKK